MINNGLSAVGKVSKGTTSLSTIKRKFNNLALKSCDI